MGFRSNLKLVERTQFLEIDFDFQALALAGEAHSLHSLLPLSSNANPEFLKWFLDNYTDPENRILDPFSLGGTLGVEASLSKRFATQIEQHPLAQKISLAKTRALDIAHIALNSQLLPLKRPIRLDYFSEEFRPFYDLDTFREIMNARVSLKNSNDSFLEVLIASILHGNSASFLSASSSPHFSLSPEEQSFANKERNQFPDYRPLAPRILKKAAMVLRDGLPSFYERYQSKGETNIGDPRNLKGVPSGSMDAIYSAPPAPHFTHPCNEMWLRSWFLGTPDSANIAYENLEPVEWSMYMNETLVELARVAKSGAPACFLFEPVRLKNDKIYPDQLLKEEVEKNLKAFWEPQLSMVQTKQTSTLGKKGELRALVLRRK